MRLLSLFRNDPSSRRKAAVRHNVRRAVAVTSRGNINLQYGRFITREDIERIRKKNLTHDFTKSR